MKFDVESCGFEGRFGFRWYCHIVSSLIPPNEEKLMSPSQEIVTTPEPVSMQKPYSASSWSMHKWAMGSGADYWMYTQFANIGLVFTTGFNLDPKLVGIALFVPRLFDGLIDPAVGHLSDITHTKWGRRRPFLFITTILGAIVSVGIWWPSTSWPQWAQFTWLTIGATLLFSIWGTYVMAFNALGYELSDEAPPKVLTQHGLRTFNNRKMV
jgi:GPH family glycoside/pentoside/hexuronide:cation symporter